MALTVTQRDALLNLMRRGDVDAVAKFLEDGRAAHIADASNGIDVTYTSGAAPAAGGSLTIADATTPTVVELLDFCEELNAAISALDTKVNAILSALEGTGLVSTS